MAYRALRFFHTAGLELDRPLGRTGRLPESLQAVVAGATFDAWANLVRASVERDVEFLLITGNSFNASAGSLKAEIALRQGFEELAAHQIPVFVTPGPLDPAEAWAEIPGLPDNVTVFSSSRDAPADLVSGRETYATIFPIDAETRIDPPELERIKRRGGGSQRSVLAVGAFCGEPYALGTDGDRRRYLSLNYLGYGTGQLHASQLSATHTKQPARENADRLALPVTEGTVHSPPRVQNFEPTRDDVAGASLVQVDPAGSISTSTVSTAIVRRFAWSQSLATARKRDDLIEAMVSRVEKQSRGDRDQLWIVDWNFTDLGPAANLVDTLAECRLLESALTEWTDQLNRVPCWHRVSPCEGFGAGRTIGGNNLVARYESWLAESGAPTHDWFLRNTPASRDLPAGWEAEFIRYRNDLDSARIMQTAWAHGRAWFSEPTEVRR